MGSPVSAAIANLVMEDIEHRALTTAPVNPSFWKRFVDDVISAVSQDEIVVLLQHLNSIAWEDSKVITTNNRHGQRLCLEAWHINASPCALNRDDGSHLPQEYLHLVGK